MVIKKTYSFPEKYWEVVKHLGEQGNASNYIAKLVLGDMQRNLFTNDIEKQRQEVEKQRINKIVEDIINQKLQNRSEIIPAINEGLKNFLTGDD